MGRALASVARLLAVGCLVLCLAPACNGGGGSSSSGQVCPAGFDGGAGIGGTEAVNEGGQCGNLLTGTTQNGQACQQSSDCEPTCCACPANSKSAQVALCFMGQCVVGPDVCCVWIDENSGSDAGPYVCAH
jgi:hypothetical protein